MTPSPDESPAGRFFLLRLIPPRPTFPRDMTADERALMQEHADYRTEVARRGTMIVFGPVADPKGPWGLGVLRVPDEATLAALQAADPVIRAQCGFRYEVLPMLRAVTSADLQAARA